MQTQGDTRWAYWRWASGTDTTQLATQLVPNAKPIGVTVLSRRYMRVWLNEHRKQVKLASDTGGTGRCGAAGDGEKIRVAEAKCCATVHN